MQKFPESEEAPRQRAMALSAQFGVLRTRELRELLEDEDKINQIVTLSQKFQGLRRATESMLVSNQRLAKATLCQRPAFRDAKLLLTMKYKELEKLSSITQAKQEQLSEKCIIHSAQQSLLKKIRHAEEECEMLFQKFAEGKTPLADFLDSFQKSRKLHHIRLVLVTKIQEMIQSEQKLQRPTAICPSTEHFAPGCHGEVHNTCHPFCGLTTTLVLPAFCHSLTCVPVQSPFLLPIGAQSLQHAPFCFDNDEPVCPRLHGQGPRWQARPVRLQPLRIQPREDQQAPH